MLNVLKLNGKKKKQTNKQTIKQVKLSPTR
jgi:hypothetical protein